MTDVVRLRDWAVVTSNASPYLAPEYLPRYLHGIAENHPEFPADSRVTTSRITGARGRLVTTGRRTYELVGGPASDYFEAMVKAGVAIDSDEPVKVR